MSYDPIRASVRESGGRSRLGRCVGTGGKPGAAAVTARSRRTPLPADWTRALASWRALRAPAVPGSLTVRISRAMASVALQRCGSFVADMSGRPPGLDALPQLRGSDGSPSAPKRPGSTGLRFIGRYREPTLRVVLRRRAARKVNPDNPHNRQGFALDGEGLTGSTTSTGCPSVSEAALAFTTASRRPGPR